MPALDVLLRFAADQHGIVTRAQIDDAAFARSTIARWVKAGRLRRMGRGIYLVEGMPFTYRTACMAAVIRPQAPSWVSRRSAAVLHGWLQPTIDNRKVGPPVEVTRAVTTNGRSIGDEIVHRSLRLPAHHCTVVDRIAVTSRPRTLVDLGVDVGEVTLTRWAKQMLRKGDCSLALLRAVALETSQQRPGAPRVRRVLAALAAEEGPADSDLSALARPLYVQAGLRPEWEADISGPLGYIGRVDSLFRPERVVVEYDSSRYHDDVDDALRDRRLVDAGYLVLRASGFDLKVRSTAFLAELQALLAARRLTTQVAA